MAKKGSEKALRFTVVEMDQRSPEWHVWRKDGIGSSDAVVIACNLIPAWGRDHKPPPWARSLQELYLAKTQGLPEEDLSGNPAVQRGVELEPAARREAENILGKKFRPVLAVNKDDPWLRASLDGFSEDCQLLELKVPGAEDHRLAMEGKIPDKYWPQLQHQMLVVGAKKMYYGSYDGLDIALVEADADKAFQTAYREAASSFWDAVTQGFGAPKPFFHTDAPEVVRLAEEYRMLKEAETRLTTKLEEVREELLRISDGKRMEVGNVVDVVHYYARGRIRSSDLVLAAQAAGIDTEKFRAPGGIRSEVRILEDRSHRADGLAREGIHDLLATAEGSQHAFTANAGLEVVRG